MLKFYYHQVATNVNGAASLRTELSGYREHCQSLDTVSNKLLRKKNLKAGSHYEEQIELISLSSFVFCLSASHLKTRVRSSVFIYFAVYIIRKMNVLDKDCRFISTKLTM